MKTLPFRRSLNWAYILIGSLALAACVSTPPQPRTQDKTLFERLGGLPAITAVVDKTVDKHASDPLTRRSFEGIKLKPLKESVVTFICQATGGPCKYEGPAMKKAHKGLAITPKEFDTTVQQLVSVLNELHVAPKEQKELLQLLGPLSHDVIAQ